MTINKCQCQDLICQQHLSEMKRQDTRTNNALVWLLQPKANLLLANQANP